MAKTYVNTCALFSFATELSRPGGVKQSLHNVTLLQTDGQTDMQS